MVGFGLVRNLGGLETRPYGHGWCINKVDYPVDVIRHYHEFIENGVRMIFRNSRLLFRHKLPKFV